MNIKKTLASIFLGASLIATISCSKNNNQITYQEVYDKIQKYGKHLCQYEDVKCTGRQVRRHQKYVDANHPEKLRVNEIAFNNRDLENPGVNAFIVTGNENDKSLVIDDFLAIGIDRKDSNMPYDYLGERDGLVLVDLREDSINHEYTYFHDYNNNGIIEDNEIFPKDCDLDSAKKLIKKAIK